MEREINETIERIANLRRMAARTQIPEQRKNFLRQARAEIRNLKTYYRQNERSKRFERREKIKPEKEKRPIRKQLSEKFYTFLRSKPKIDFKKKFKHINYGYTPRRDRSPGSYPLPGANIHEQRIQEKIKQLNELHQFRQNRIYPQDLARKQNEAIRREVNRKAEFAKATNLMATKMVVDPQAADLKIIPFDSSKDTVTLFTPLNSSNLIEKKKVKA